MTENLSKIMTQPVSTRPLASMTLAEFNAAHPPREPFHAKGPAQFAYRTAQARFRMSWEYNFDGGRGLCRNDAQHEAGIDAAAVDTAQFAKDVLAGLGDHISLSDMEALAAAFQAAAQEWRREHEQACLGRAVGE